MKRRKGTMGITEQSFMITCETFGCQNKGKYVIGNTGAKHTCFTLCEECIEELKEVMGVNSVKEVVIEKQTDVVEVKAEPTKEEAVGVMLLEKLKADGKITKTDLFEIAEIFGVEVDQKASNQDILEAIVGANDDK